MYYIIMRVVDNEMLAFQVERDSFQRLGGVGDMAVLRELEITVS